MPATFCAKAPWDTTPEKIPAVAITKKDRLFIALDPQFSITYNFAQSDRKATIKFCDFCPITEQLWQLSIEPGIVLVPQEGPCGVRLSRYVKSSVAPLNHVQKETFVGASPLMVLVPSNALHVVERVGPVAKKALIDFGVLLLRDCL